MLAEKLGPDGLIAFETIAIERIVPARLGVNVLAFLRIAAVIGLLEGPAVRNSVVDIGHRRKRVGRDIFDVIGIGVEAMAKLAIRAEGRLCFGGKSGTKLGKTRQAGARLHGCNGDERDFKGYHFVWLQGQVGKNERRVVLGFDAELVMASWQRENSEDALTRSSGAEDLAGLDVSQRENGGRNR